MKEKKQSERKNEFIKYGKFIRDRRIKIGLSQSSLSKKVSVSQGTISKIEHGIVIPDVLLWTKMCKLFELRVLPDLEAVDNIG